MVWHLDDSQVLPWHKVTSDGSLVLLHVNLSAQGNYSCYDNHGLLLHSIKLRLGCKCCHVIWKVVRFRLALLWHFLVSLQFWYKRRSFIQQRDDQKFYLKDWIVDGFFESSFMGLKSGNHITASGPQRTLVISTTKTKTPLPVTVSKRKWLPQTEGSFWGRGFLIPSTVYETTTTTTTSAPSFFFSLSSGTLQPRNICWKIYPRLLFFQIPLVCLAFPVKFLITLLFAAPGKNRWRPFFQSSTTPPSGRSQLLQLNTI